MLRWGKQGFVGSRADFLKNDYRGGIVKAKTVRINQLRLIQLIILTTNHHYLRNKHKTKCNCCTENNQDGQNRIKHIRVKIHHVHNSHAQGAREYYVVHRHTDMLGVVQRGKSDIPCFPGHKRAKRQHEAFVGVDNSKPNVWVCGGAVDKVRLVLSVRGRAVILKKHKG